MTFITKDRVQKMSNRSLFGSRPFVSDKRIDGLRNILTSGTIPSRVWQKWVIINSTPVDYIVRGPVETWHMYESYGATEAEREYNDNQLYKIEGDFNAAVDLAMQYRLGMNLSGEITDPTRYAFKVVEILTAWSRLETFSTNNGSILPWNDYWSVLLQAAMLVKDHYAYTKSLHDSLVQLTKRMYASMNVSNGYDGSQTSAMSNWGAVGNQNRFAVATFTGDRELFDGAVYRWRQQFNDSIKSNFLGVDGNYHDNVPIHEIYRQGSTQGDGSYGLLYSNYDFSAKVVGAEWARLNGEWLYDYVAPDGSSFAGLFETITEWNRYPDAEHHWFNTSNPPVRFYARQLYAGFDVAHRVFGVGNPDSEWLVENLGIGFVENGAFSDKDHDFMRCTDLLYKDQPVVGW